MVLVVFHMVYEVRYPYPNLLLTLLVTRNADSLGRYRENQS